MRDVRDMAHLPLLSGWHEIAGFPRSAKCGSEFFHCSSPLRSLSFSLMFVTPKPPHTLPLPPMSCGLKSHFFFDAFVILD